MQSLYYFWDTQETESASQHLLCATAALVTLGNAPVEKKMQNN